MSRKVINKRKLWSSQRALKSSQCFFDICQLFNWPLVPCQSGQNSFIKYLNFAIACWIPPNNSRLPTHSQRNIRWKLPQQRMIVPLIFISYARRLEVAQTAKQELNCCSLHSSIRGLVYRFMNFFLRYTLFTSKPTFSINFSDFYLAHREEFLFDCKVRFTFRQGEVCDWIISSYAPLLPGNDNIKNT